MSHHLLSKKLWIGITIMTCTFLGMAYGWLYYADQWSMQAEMSVGDEETGHAEVELEEKTSTAEAVNQTTTDPIEKGKIQEVYPCVIQMIQGQIGIYTEKGEYLRELNQVGELLGEIDRNQLQQGIWIENEKELIVILESYHLQ